MGLVIVVVAGALVVGGLRHGSLTRLSALRLRWLWLVLVAVVAQAVGAVAGIEGVTLGYQAGMAVSGLAALVFCARNIAVPGLLLVGLGLAANAAVIGLNGAMPVSPAAAARAGADISAVSSGTDPRHVIADDRTTARLLGDVVPVPLPVRAEVDSAGDVLIAAGLALFVVSGMGNGPVGRRRQERPAGRGRREAAAEPPLPAPTAWTPFRQEPDFSGLETLLDR